MNMEARKRIMAARTAMILDEPFFGTLALRLALKEDPSCNTAWVNGRELGYNPKFVLSLTHAEVVSLMIHEVMHCASGHPWRRGGRDNREFNKGADIAINPEIRAAGHKLPDGALFPEQYQLPVGKSAEWYCDRLPRAPEPEEGEEEGAGEPGDGEQGSGSQSGDQPGEQDESKQPQSKDQQQEQDDQDESEQSQPDESDSSELGEVRDAPTAGTDDEPSPSEEEWKQAVQQAAVLAAAQGKLPGAMKRFAEKAAKSRIDWRSALRRFVQEQARADYSWSRPNPRYMPQGVYLPALHSEEMGVLAVGVDTSGSIDQILLDQFAAEVQAVADELHPRQIRVFYADAAIQGEQVFERDEPVEFKPAGGGGTDFRPVFEAAAQMDEPPVCVVYLTDLYGTFPKQDPGIPTLWVTAEESTVKVPFGEVVSAN